MNERLNESDVLERFQHGDTSVFKEIVLAYQDRIYRLCRYMLGNPQDAEDAAQDTFLKTYQNLKNFTPSASLYTWIYRIAVNTCIDYKRRNAFEGLFKRSDNEEDLIAREPSTDPSPERLSESGEASGALQKALNALSRKLRAVIVMKEIEGLSYEDIAAALDISMGTVKSRISRAREELKKLMKGLTTTEED